MRITKIGLEEKLRNVGNNCLDGIANMYDKAYSKHPSLTNYLSSAVGTVGGDIIAKQFTDNPNIKARDIAFTASAAIAYSYLTPKMIEWSTQIMKKPHIANIPRKIVKMASHIIKPLKEESVAEIMSNSVLLTFMYYPINTVYWNYLTIKNQMPITKENILVGAMTLGIATIPYLYADYMAIKKYNQPHTQKYLRPFYSAVEIVWNTLFAGGNYLTKRFS